MQKTKILMGMPVTIEVNDRGVMEENMDEIFEYFRYVDEKFSTYKGNSEITLINNKKIKNKKYSEDMAEVLNLSEQTKRETGGYFDIRHNGKLDPSGLVKGWAIYKAAGKLKAMGFDNYFVDAGGDIQTQGLNKDGKKWRVGIRNPFDRTVVIKIVEVSGEGVATSGTYMRGEHVYNPLSPESKLSEIVSLTVIGPNIFDADRMATAAFAMGREGILFISGLPGFSGYMIDKDCMAIFSPGFDQYEIH